MGSVVGEKFARACERATEDETPLVSVAASGGARMQEGILALMQLPKTVVAIEELHESGGSLVSVLTHPTTGGVLASFASLGDVVLAEPGALMSFAGPRVVAQTTREKLPDDFGLAESNYRFGHVDAIVPRAELRPTLGQLLRLFEGGVASAASLRPRLRTPSGSSRSESAFADSARTRHDAERGGDAAARAAQ